MNRRARSAALPAIAFAFFSVSASAQTPRAPIAGRIEVAAGVLAIGAVSFGSRDATLTAPDGSRFRLFSTSSDLASAAGLEVRVGGRVTRAIEAEVTSSFAVPRLNTAVTNDVEAAASTTASEPITQITIEGGALVYLPWRLGRRSAPFVIAGGGYLRELHEGQALAQTGRIYHVGGGIKMPLVSRASPRGWLKQMGVRIDARAVIRTAGVTLDAGAHTAPAVAASAFVRF